MLSLISVLLKIRSFKLKEVSNGSTVPVQGHRGLACLLGSCRILLGVSCNSSEIKGLAVQLHSQMEGALCSCICIQPWRNSELVQVYSSMVPNQGYYRARRYPDHNIFPQLSRLPVPWQKVAQNSSERRLESNPTVEPLPSAKLSTCPNTEDPASYGRQRHILPITESTACEQNPSVPTEPRFMSRNQRNLP
jgi:hypothetical protein